MITSCTIDVRLRLQMDSLNQLQQADAENVAHFSEHLLSEHQLAVSISVVGPVSDDNFLPTPDVLSALGKLLRQFDTFSVPFEQPADRDTPRPVWSSAVTCQHAKALQGSKLAVLTANLLNSATASDWMKPTVHSIEYVGSMSCLTKLHLTVSVAFEAHPMNFEPLARLSLLEDLVLQCVHEEKPTCCGGVLASNRQTLRLVALSAPSWSGATYDSLQDLDHLEVCHVNTAELNIAQAHAFGRISAAHFILTLRSWTRGGQSIQALNNSKAGLHSLTLWRVSCQHVVSLPDLPCLEQLTFIDCPWLRDKLLTCSSTVTQLTLIDQPVAESRLQYMTRKALPALKSVSFCSTLGHSGIPELTLRTTNALCFGQHLETVDLRGVDGLTEEQVVQFQAALHKKQGMNEAQSVVKVLLPTPCLSSAQATLEQIRSFDLPFLYRLRVDGDVLELVVRKHYMVSVIS